MTQNFDVILDAVEVQLGTFHLGPIVDRWSSGSFVLLTGANGSGKTTLLRVVAGLLEHSGHCEVGDCAPGNPGLGAVVALVSDTRNDIPDTLSSAEVWRHLDHWWEKEEHIGERPSTVAYPLADRLGFSDVRKRVGGLSHLEKELNH